MFRIKKYNNGFTLMEVIIAIALITAGLIGSLILINFAISGASLRKSKVIAANLAQEGLEVVRNIRDSNWLDGAENWRRYLPENPWRAQYNGNVLYPYEDTPLEINSEGFYGYDGIAGFVGETETPFYRKITIKHVGADQINVTCEVTWSERGRDQKVILIDQLYNWK